MMSVRVARVRRVLTEGCILFQNKVYHVYRAIICCTILLCFCFMFSAHATSVTLPYSFTAGSPISASQMMGNFSSIASALSSTVSSPWVASSSNIYFNTGSVGIGSSAPAHALDVNGSVVVSTGNLQQVSPVYFAAYQTSTAVANSIGTKVNFGNTITGHAAYNASTSTFVAPVGGLYYINYLLDTAGINAAGLVYAYIYVNNLVIYATNYNSTSTLRSIPLSCIYKLNLNDQVTVGTYQTTGSAQTYAGGYAGWSFFSVALLF